MVKCYLDCEQPLLCSIAHNDKGATAGWWREIGKGRVVHLSHGQYTGCPATSNDLASYPERDVLVLADRLIPTIKEKQL